MEPGEIIEFPYSTESSKPGWKNKLYCSNCAMKGHHAYVSYNIFLFLYFFIYLSIFSFLFIFLNLFIIIFF